MLATQTMEYHKPVLLKETVDGLNIQPNGVYVDVTFGGGGHSKEIIKRLGEEGKLIAFDQDTDALENAIDDPRFLLINENFRFLKRFLRFYGYKQVDGILGRLSGFHLINLILRNVDFQHGSTPIWICVWIKTRNSLPMM